MPTSGSLLTGKAWTLEKYRPGLIMPNSGFLFTGEFSLSPRLANGFGTIGRVSISQKQFSFYPCSSCYFVHSREKSSFRGVYGEELSARFHLCEFRPTIPRRIFRSESLG